jgi:circadian clock protein KaiC
MLSETEQELRAVAASHGWSLDGLELFQLSAMEGSRQQDQYTLYHPAEVELGETMQKVTQRLAARRARAHRIPGRAHRRAAVLRHGRPAVEE